LAYRTVFSRRAQKAFLELPVEDARRIREALEELEREPRGLHPIKLEHAPVAEYRRRVGNFRILFDIVDQKEILQILDIRRRSEKTYK
jgi:mRNA interferase RelE/StbE